MTALQSFPPEICSLICQDPILERLDLNSICFISHAFRNEAQRELSYRFPFLRGVSRIRAWCLSLQNRPHLAIIIKGLVLLLPQPSAFRAVDIAHLTVELTRALHMCVNLKELAVLFNQLRPGLQEPMYSSSIDMLNDHQFKLTKFVNRYFSQDNAGFQAFLGSQPNLESLELHSGETFVSNGAFILRNLKTLSCPPHFFDKSFGILTSDARIRLDFENWTGTPDIVLRHMLSNNLICDVKSLAIFLRQGEYSFPKVLRAIAVRRGYIPHIEIHQFLPTQIKEDMPLPVKLQGWNIRTLVFRPPPGLPEKAGDNPNLCAYVELRTSIGRRKAAERLMMRALPTLKRLVLVVHGKDYVFRRKLRTGGITKGKLITRDTREWALVK